MLRSGALVGLLCGALGAAACDSGDVEPRPFSTFQPEQPSARQILGRVYQGTETVAGALVRVDATTPGLGSDELLAATSTLPRTASTDASGFYRVPFAPFMYDLSVRSGSTLLVMRGVAARFVEPQLGADAPVTGFQARVVPTTEPPPGPGNAVTFLVSGRGARTIREVPGTPGTLDVIFSEFDSVLTLHALEYVVASGLSNVVRAGRAEIRIKAGEVSAPHVLLGDVINRNRITFEATLPDGYTMSSLEVVLDPGLRTSAALVGRPLLGVPFELSVVPGLPYSVTALATSAGGVSSSGRMLFDANLEKVTLSMPSPVSAESPIDDAATPAPPTVPGGAAPVPLEPGGVLAARFDEGVLEHVLTPAGGDGPTLRIATTSRATTLPDATLLGLPQAVGPYTWTIEHFPTFEHVEWLSGPGGRVFPKSWKSAPKSIILR